MDIYEPCRVCNTLTLAKPKKKCDKVVNNRVYATKHVYCSYKCGHFGSQYNNLPKKRLQAKFVKMLYQDQVYNSFIYGVQP